jgi:lysophospholipase L1-like esterase
MNTIIFRRLKSLVFIVVFFCFVSSLQAQTACPAFWSDIQAFKKADSAQMPPKGAILFVGSSSFTKWKDVQAYFPGYTIINRGFGGSQLTDVIRYAYDVILPYSPKQVVIYCGENDLASPALHAEEAVLRFKTLFGMIRQNLPNATIDFISMKPSPSRQSRFPEFRKANAEIKAFLQKQKNAAFINVYDAMLDAKGNPRKEIFLEDNLHMKPEGYRIWQKIIQPYLKKD